MGSHGFLRIPMVSYGFLWVLMHSYWLILLRLLLQLLLLQLLLSERARTVREPVSHGVL